MSNAKKQRAVWLANKALDNNGIPSQTCYAFFDLLAQVYGETTAREIRAFVQNTDNCYYLMNPLFINDLGQIAD